MDQVGTYLPPQINEFKCKHCGTHIEVSAIPHVPVFPCQVCDHVAWEIHAINGKVIYPWKAS